MRCFLRVTRTDGLRPPIQALVLPEWIGAISANKEVLSKGEPAEDVLTIHLTNNVVWNLVGETEASLLSKMNQALGQRVHITEEAHLPAAAA